MPLAHARYDLLVHIGAGACAPSVHISVDMLEERDVDECGMPGRLRSAKLARYRAPPGCTVTYERLALRGRSRYCLLVNGRPYRRGPRLPVRAFLVWAGDPAPD